MEKRTGKRSIGKTIMPIVLGLVLIGGAIFGIREYIYYQHYQTTDDAQIDGDISPVVARVSGYVKDILFTDNQFVHAGDTLVILDDRDYRVKLEQAEAALKAAMANVNVSRSNVQTVAANVQPAEARVAAAKVQLWKAQQDYNRYLNLLHDHAITQAQFDAVKAQRDAAEAELEAAQKQVAALHEQVSTTQQQVKATASNIDIQRAEVDFAKLQLSYTVITAPVSGIVSKRNIQPGQLVQAGQTLFSIVMDSSIYVTANFKETQIGDIHVGQKVDIDVDAYPDTTFEGVVESFSGATGAKFSLLPPDNATGNFVKVVQRVPVRIAFTKLNDEWRRRLRPGLSVFVRVHIKP
ncbi:HlyD family secretion protein [Thermoflavifilum thermophilum]|uniref:Membrane fusion protein, multidrug efflux system n=1 Tax=Thermoflavifilum thermophilum TaxID=1393122 RepID=A0A1I7NCS6_9BACT|nr:HlyD family secretion protein [Thermoflavifilum thermophilum]SFV32459.1 membrane fusion protein, multidrug efflux system [Thermoflavifilum thermophilum]